MFSHNSNHHDSMYQRSNQLNRDSQKPASSRSNLMSIMDQFKSDDALLRQLTSTHHANKSATGNASSGRVLPARPESRPTSRLGFARRGSSESGSSAAFEISTEPRGDNREKTETESMLKWKYDKNNNDRIEAGDEEITRNTHREGVHGSESLSENSQLDAETSSVNEEIASLCNTHSRQHQEQTEARDQCEELLSDLDSIINQTEHPNHEQARHKNAQDRHGEIAREPQGHYRRSKTPNKRITPSKRTTPDRVSVDRDSNTGTRRTSREITPEKEGSDAGIRDVLEIVQSLKAQFDTIKNQLETSNRSQQSLEREIGNLKKERALLQSVRSRTPSRQRDASAHSSQSSLSELDMRSHHRSHYSLPEPVSRYMEDRRVTNPLLSSYIASLPPPEEMDLPPDHRYSDTDESSSSVAQDLVYSNEAYSSLRTRHPSHNRQAEYGSLANNRHSSSMFDLYGGSRGNRRQIQHHQQTQRLKLLRDMTESERLYCTDLWNITQNYSKLLYSTGAIGRKDIGRVFPAALTRMYEEHCGLLKSLNRSASNYKHSQLIGDVFSKFTRNKKADLFLEYKDYIEKFPGTIRVINRLQHSSQLFRKVLTKSRREGGAIGSSQQLIGVLIKPVERVPVYFKFLKHLLASTAEESPDKHHLQTTADVFRRFLKSINHHIESCVQVSGVQAVHNTATLSHTSHVSQPHNRRSERDRRYHGRHPEIAETSSFSSYDEDRIPSTKDSGIDSHEDYNHYHNNRLSMITHRGSSNNIMGQTTPTNDMRRQYEDRARRSTSRESSRSVRSVSRSNIGYVNVRATEEVHYASSPVHENNSGLEESRERPGDSGEETEEENESSTTHSCLSANMSHTSKYSNMSHTPKYGNNKNSPSNNDNSRYDGNSQHGHEDNQSAGSEEEEEGEEEASSASELASHVVPFSSHSESNTQTPESNSRPESKSHSRSESPQRTYHRPESPQRKVHRPESPHKMIQSSRNNEQQREEVPSRSQTPNITSPTGQLSADENYRMMTQSTPDLHNDMNYEIPSSHHNPAATAARSKVRFRTPVVEAPAVRKYPPNTQIVNSNNLNSRQHKKGLTDHLKVIFSRNKRSMSEKRPASAPRSSTLRQQQQQQQPGQRSVQRHASGPPTNKSAEVNTSQHRYATEQRESQVAHHETPRRPQDGNIDRLKKSSRAQTASPLTTLSSADINTRRRNNNNQQDYHSTKNAQEKGTKRTDAYPGSKMSPPYSVFSNSQSIHHIDEEEIEEVSVATEPCSSV